MTASRKEQVISVCFCLFSIVLLVLSYQLRGKGIAAIGPGFMPRVIAVALLILSVSNFIIHTKKQISGKDVPETPDAPSKEPITYFRLGSTILLLFVYVFFLTTVGFPAMTFLYLFLQFLLFSRKVTLKTVLKDLVLAAVSSLVITIIFYRLLNLFLPMGIWF